MLSLVSFNEAAVSKSKAKKKFHDCAATFLIDNDSTYKHFNYVPGPVESDDCEEKLDEFRESVYELLEVKLNEDEDFKNHTDCIIKKSKEFNIADAHIEKSVYTNDVTMSRLKREEALNHAIASSFQKLELAEELCAPELMFGNWFDELYGEDPSTESTNSNETEDDIGSLQEDYCHRKRLVDSKFIDVTIFNITVNPSNIDVTDLDCDKLWFETTEETGISLKDQFEGGLDDPSKKEIRCFSNTIRKGNYAETLLKVWMISEVRTTEKQQAIEREAFINFMTNLYADILKCQQ